MIAGRSAAACGPGAAPHKQPRSHSAAVPERACAACTVDKLSQPRVPSWSRWKAGRATAGLCTDRTEPHTASAQGRPWHARVARGHVNRAHSCVRRARPCCPPLMCAVPRAATERSRACDAAAASWPRVRQLPLATPCPKSPRVSVLQGTCCTPPTKTLHPLKAALGPHWPRPTSLGACRGCAAPGFVAPHRVYMGTSGTGWAAAWCILCVCPSLCSCGRWCQLPRDERLMRRHAHGGVVQAAPNQTAPLEPAPDGQC